MHFNFGFTISPIAVILMVSKGMDNFRQQRQGAARRNTVDGFVTRPNRTMSYPTTPNQRPVRPLAQQRRQPQARPTVKAARPRLDMSLPGAEPLEFRKAQIRKRVSIVRHWAFKTTVVALALLIGSGGLLFAQGIFSAQRVFKGGAQAAALQAQVNPNMLKGEGSGRVNILLLGVGGIGHEAPDLTDTIMVASIDPVNKKADLLSVPRDLYVKVPGSRGSGKINSAYEVGKYAYLHKMDSSNANTAAVMAGFKTADQAVENVLGIDIHYNLLVNFHSFQQGVDSVGGVTINVPERLYDPTMAWENNRNPVLADVGPQNFDGKHALIYARSRETTSDFARSQRQRALILALKQKVVTLGTLSNPVKISKLMNTFGSNVVTDLSMNDANRVYSLTKNITDNKVGSIGLADNTAKLVTTGRVGNQSVVIPTAGQDNYDAIQAYVRKALPDGYIVKEHAKIAVLNGTSIEGLGTERADALKAYGYNVTTVQNAPTKTYNRTVLVHTSKVKKAYTQHYLERRFGVKSTSVLPDSTIQKGSADFILIIGNQ
jgi:LCP family protein required for cell wall assembly